MSLHRELHRELFEGTKDVGISLLALAILLGLSVGIGLFFHFV
jgi:hypothetical protein